MDVERVNCDLYNEPMISVIVPVYNVEKYIRKCIESIIKQTYHNLEIILVDDGSTDNSGMICDDYAKRDKRIQVIHKKNEGLSDARNSGIKICKGDYIGFIDGDDWIAKDMYEFLYQTLTKYHADVAVCGHYLEGDDGVYDSENAEGGLKVYNSREAVCAVVKDKEIHSYAWDKLYKKELFDGIRYPSGRYVQDIFTTYRVFINANKVVCNNQPKYYYYQRKDSIQRTRGSKLNWDQFCAYKESMSVLEHDYPELKVFLMIRLVSFGIAAYNCLILKDQISGEEEQQKKEILSIIQRYGVEIKKCKYGGKELRCRIGLVTLRGYDKIYPKLKKIWMKMR